MGKGQADLARLGSRVYLTEFGASLNLSNIGYEDYVVSGLDGNVNCLRGLHDGLRALRASGQPLRGVYHWHGWNNGDCYDFWDAGNKNGACKVQSIMAEIKQPFSVHTSQQPLGTKEEDPQATVAIYIFRKAEMTYLVADSDPMFQWMSRWSWNYERVGFEAWGSEKEGVVPIYCFRKGEVALYCHSTWDRWSHLAN